MSKRSGNKTEGNKRLRIIEAAIDCLHQYGGQPVNLSQVAREMGLSQPLVFYYFPGQNSLLKAMLEHVVQTNREHVGKRLQSKGSLTHKKSLEIYLRENLNWAESHPQQVAVILTFICVGQSNPEIREMTRQALEQGRQTVYGFLTGGIAENEFKLMESPRHTAEAIHDSLIGSIVFHHCAGAEAVDGWIRRCLSLHLLPIKVRRP